MNRSIRCIDLDDVTVLALPNYTDLLPFVSEWSIARAPNRYFHPYMLMLMQFALYECSDHTRVIP
jgi:hypothetical protein